MGIHTTKTTLRFYMDTGNPVTTEPVTMKKGERKPRKRLKQCKNVDEKITEEIQANITHLQKLFSDQQAEQAKMKNVLVEISNSLNETMRMLRGQGVGEDAKSKKKKKKKTTEK